jgi:hypothetical protein
MTNNEKARQAEKDEQRLAWIEAQSEKHRQQRETDYLVDYLEGEKRLSARRSEMTNDPR